MDSFIATFHDHSFVPNHDWEAGTEGGLVDEGLKDVTYQLEDRGFVCVSVRPSPGAGYIVDDQGWAEVIDEVIRVTSWEPGRQLPRVDLILRRSPSNGAGRPGRSPVAMV